MYTAQFRKSIYHMPHPMTIISEINMNKVIKMSNVILYLFSVTNTYLKGKKKLHPYKTNLFRMEPNKTPTLGLWNIESRLM